MDRDLLMRLLRRPSWVGYLLAVVGPCVAVWVRVGVLGDALHGYPFLTFFPAVVLAAWFGGWPAGLAAAMLSGGLAEHYLITPEFAFRPVDPGSLIGLSFFALVSAGIIAIIEATRRLNQTLEKRLAERTKDLAEANVALRAEIASRQAIEAQMRHAHKMEAIGQLTGGVAHDFNNMLAVISGNLTIAKRRLAQGQADIGRFITHAQEGAERAAGLTRRLLAFSRRQALAPEVLDLNELVRGMAELLHRTLGERIELECVVAAGLWRTLVDPGQLESAILNLAVNGRDAMPDGGRLTIETANAFLDDHYVRDHAELQAGQYVMVAVTDRGAGMSPEVLERAFDPFFTTKDVGQGTGLGLSQVYGFVKQSGGHVKLYSEIGYGTTVKIYLPRQIVPSALATVDSRGSTEAPAALAPGGAGDEIILVVEDQESVRRTTVDALRELGYTVRHAGSGSAAMAMLESQPGVDLLFTDVVMPGMSGGQLAEQVASRWPRMKILFTTGYTRNSIVHNGVINSGVDLLMKPFALDDLAHKIRLVLDRPTPSEG